MATKREFILEREELKSFLDEKVEQYNRPNFIETDPIQIPKKFSLKEDIEIAGFLVSVIAWGQRKTIINNGLKMMDLFGNSPYDFVMSHEQKDLERLQKFVHRTFNGQDLEQFVLSLRNLYTHHNGLESAFAQSIKNEALQEGISDFKALFFTDLKHKRTLKKHQGLVLILFKNYPCNFFQTSSFNSITPSWVTLEKKIGFLSSGNSAAISCFNSSSNKSDLEMV